MIDVQTTASDENRQLQSLNVSGPSGTGQVFFQGAQIVQWTPNGAEPVLWLSSRNQFRKSRPIRGGIPICLPWFGSTAAPRHGITRTLPWQLTSVDQNTEHVTLTFDLDYKPMASNASAWPHPFQARLQVKFSQFLIITLQVTHLGHQPALYEPALHPYFQIGDIRRVRISGLNNAPFVDHSATPSTDSEIAFNEQGLDRVYTCSTEVTIHDDANNRDIILHAPNARSRIIWNPGVQGSNSIQDLDTHDWRSFLCLEPGNVHENAIILAPGENHSFQSVIQVVAHQLRTRNTQHPPPLTGAD